jgi:hypothetical protein
VEKAILFGGSKVVSCYDRFVESIRNAGFFTTGVEHKRGWDRVTVCSQRLPGPHYTGNSFWVSAIGKQWYAGAWGGSIYRVNSEDALIGFAIEWLTVEPNRTVWDFSPEVREKHLLEPVSDYQFKSAIRKRRSGPPKPDSRSGGGTQ